MVDYRNSFLTKPRFHTRDRDYAERSLWQWTWPEERDDGDLDVLDLSLLGIINGILPHIPVLHPVLVVKREEGPPRKIVGYEFRRKWW